jgi:cytochrome c peroxidase
MRDGQGMLKTLVFLVFVTFILFALADRCIQPALGSSDTKPEGSPVVRLGERLFRDERFSTPDGDLPASCSHCHLLDEDPQGLRAFADFFNRSWMSYRIRDQRRLMLRNAPTIFDVAEMPRLHYDGEFASLEDLVKGTLLGRPMGWLPGEEARAFDHARRVVLDDRGEDAGATGSYREQFRKAFGVEVERLSRDETVNFLAKAVADYCRTLTTRRDSAYDKFIETNRLESAPASGEDGKAFSVRLLAAISSLESRGSLELNKDFDRTALEGLKIFFRADRGNCAACHAPPLFTDHSFHNIGISQREYDRFHGEGKFAELAIPSAGNTVRPSPQFREAPARDKPGLADLGFWNFVDLKSSGLRRAGEGDEQFLRRMTATFKTPTLRNLRYTHPYFHDGSVHTLEDVLSEMISLSELARAGRLRSADEEMAKVSVKDSDIPMLAAFLNSLNEDLKKAQKTN